MRTASGRFPSPYRSCKVFRPVCVSFLRRGVVVWPSDEPRQACHDRGPARTTRVTTRCVRVSRASSPRRSWPTSPPTSATVRRVAAASINWPPTIGCWRGSRKPLPAEQRCWSPRPSAARRFRACASHDEARSTTRVQAPHAGARRFCPPPGRSVTTTSWPRSGAGAWGWCTRRGTGASTGWRP